MTDEINSCVGKWLLEKGHTKTDLANTIGVSLPMLTNKLQGETKWSWPEVCALADALDVSLETLRGN